MNMNFIVFIDDLIKVVPSLQNRLEQKILVGKLLEVGVEDQEDLKYVKEKDISPPLKPVKARRIIEVWQQSKKKSLGISKFKGVV